MLFWFVRNSLYLIMRFLYRVTVSGTENIPHDGPFIICANHIHSLDPGAIAVCVRRRLYFIAKKEIWNSPIKRPFLKPLGVFPVNRDAVDMKAYRRAIEVINNGNGLLVFSQGHRMKDLTEFKSGAALFALKTGVSIIPAGITGTYKRKSTIRVKIGAPITMTEYQGRKVKSDVVDELMAHVVERVKELTK